MKIKKLNENTKFKVNDKVFVKPNKKQGKVLKVKGDYITVEMDNGKDPIRIDTYYDTDLKLIEAKEILYVIKDSHGNQLSRPNPDDGE